MFGKRFGDGSKVPNLLMSRISGPYPYIKFLDNVQTNYDHFQARFISKMYNTKSKVLQ